MCIWSSLRFSDAQHVRWSSLNAASNVSVLRGISYRTKTGTRGAPFALGGCGLSASKGGVPWMSAWLHGLQQVWDCLRIADSSVEPDCLFFRCDLAARTFELLSYTQCLRVLRAFVKDWLGAHDFGQYSSQCLVSSKLSIEDLVASYSLHSCKATVLSCLISWASAQMFAWLRGTIQILCFSLRRCILATVFFLRCRHSPGFCHCWSWISTLSCFRWLWSSSYCLRLESSGASTSRRSAAFCRACSTGQGVPA